MANLAQRLPSLALSLLKTDGIPALWQQISWAVLRVVAGAVMIHNGFDKLEDISGFASAYVEVIGLPFPLFFAYVAAYTELLGAPLVMVGLLTRPAALGLFSTMAVAIFHHIKVAGLSIPYLELSSLYAGVFLSLVAYGGGTFSVDYWLTGWLGQDQRQQQLQALETSLGITDQIIQAGIENKVSQ